VPVAVQPEILPPDTPASRGSSSVSGRIPGPVKRFRAGVGSRVFDDAHLDLLSHLLDDFIRIPGTPIRFGLDGIVGFIPGIGDIIGGVASTIIIVAAWSRGVPRATLARMVLNVAIETAAGALPVAGNLFDIGWRANRRNYALLTKALGRPQHKRISNWIFLACVCLILASLMCVPLVLGGWALVHLAHLARGGTW
jgi:hypothetical protein